MRTARATTRLLVGAVCLAAVAACTHGPPRPPQPTKPPTTKPPAMTVLIEYKASGGMCPVDMCGADVTIYRSGAWHSSVGSRESDGQLDATVARDLAQRVDSQIASLADLPDGPELCPSAYDGSDITITFHAGRTSTTVTNCDEKDRSRNVEIPGRNPLLRHTTELIGSLLYDTPTPGKNLVEYHESGGHCREICPEENVTIGTDGAWTATSGPMSTSGTLNGRQLADLQRQIQAGVGTLAGLPPSTGCPSAYDGRDVEITFADGRQNVSVSNCEKDFEGNALLDYTTQLVDGLLP